MLNWKIEEQEYIQEEFEQYYKNLSTLQRLFMSERTNKKNLEYIRQNAQLEYRKMKLNKIIDEIQDERKRINKVVDDINNNFNDFLKEQNCIIQEKTKAFEIKSNEVTSPTEVTPMEIIYIYSEPFKMGFMQEKIQ